MAPATQTAHSSKPQKSKPQKRPRLPANTKISKRPLIHAPIPTPRSSAQQTIYLRTSTPFIPTVKRIRGLLTHIAARRIQALIPRRGAERLTAAHVEAVAVDELRAERVGKEGESVVVKASGKAIGNALSVGSWFAEKGERVRVRTGTLGAVDDLGGHDGVDPEAIDPSRVDADVVDENMAGNAGDDKEAEEEVPEARVRYINFVEVAIIAR